MIDDIRKELALMQGTIKMSNKQPVYFIGSGMSRRYLNAPDWTCLLKDIAHKAECDYDNLIEEYGNNNERIAQELEYYLFRKASSEQIRNKNRRVLLRECIAECVSKHEIVPEYTDEIKALKRTRPEAIITTNYDTLLESIFDWEYNVHIGQNEIIKNELNKAGNLYKIHGCISEPDSIVITKEDYDEFFRNCKYLYAKLLTMFWEYPLIFMGYSISDRNIKDILTSIVEIMSDNQLKEFSNKIWILDRATDEESVERKSIELFNGKSITVTYFRIDNYSEFFNAISFITSNQQFGDLKFSISEDVIELLIKPLYEKQDKLKVVTREMLQNALDACKKKKVNAEIKIQYVEDDNSNFLVIQDNGIGMNLQEINRNFLTVGKTNKKNSDEGLVGKYGVGILSIFLVGEYAEVYTKKVDTSQIAFKVYIQGDKKQVSWLEDTSTIEDMNDDSYTIIKVKILEPEKLNCDRKIDSFISLLGLDGYLTSVDNTISIKFKEHTKELLKIKDNEYFYKISDEISIYKSQWNEIDEDKKSTETSRLLSILSQNDVIFYNDMISKVIYNKSFYKQLDGINIPFTIINIKNLKNRENDFKTELSRNSVEITGNMMREIARGIYTLEINKVFELLSDGYKLILNDKMSIYELRLKIHRESKIFGKKCDLLTYNNKLVIATYQYFEHIEIWGNEKTGSHIINEIDKHKVIYRTSTLHKTSLADKIIDGKLICVSQKYLDEYIYNATGPNNGLKIAALKKIFEILSMPNTARLQGSDEVWGYVKNNKDNIRNCYIQQSKKGILWFQNEYRRMEDENTLDEHFVAFNSSSINHYIDEEFRKIFAAKLEVENHLKNIIMIM